MKINNKILEAILNNLYVLIRNKSFTFFLLFYCVHFSFSQNFKSGKVEYEVRVSEDFDVGSVFKGNPKLKGVDVSTKNALMDAMMEPAKFELFFNQKESIYKISAQEKDMDVDLKKKNLNKAFLQLLGGGDNLYYTNMSTRLILVQDLSKVLDKLYLISYNFTKWKLLNETKRIGNYMCYKAVRKVDSLYVKKGRQAVVWYTPQIPVQFGPKLYNGLPGLVIEVEIGKNIFSATKIVLNPSSTIGIKKPVKGKKITAEEYRKKIIEMSKNLGF